MKKFKNLVFSLLFVLIFPAFLFACTEETFDSVAWESSDKSVGEAVTLEHSQISYMLTSLGLASQFETTTTYTFFSRLEEETGNQSIVDKTTTTFSSNSSVNSVASVETIRSLSSEKTNQTSQTYDQTNATLYVSKTTFLDSGNSVFLDRQTYSTVDFSFEKILNLVVYNVSLNEVSEVYKKTYENVTYYKLDSKAVSSETGLDVVNKNFTENKNLWQNPSLFEIYDKDVDYVTSFTIVFGIDSHEYLTYFSLEYNIEQANNVLQGKRKVYLKVKSETKLTSFGDNVQTPTLPENTGSFTSSTFVRNLNSDDTYIQYWGLINNEYTKVVVYKSGENLLCNTIKTNSNKDETGEYSYYYFHKTENGYDKYQIFLDENSQGTYSPISTNFSFLNFYGDFSYNSRANNTYSFVSSAGTTLYVNLENGEVASLYCDGTSTYTVLKTGNGSPNNVYDLEGKTLVEEE